MDDWRWGYQQAVAAGVIPSDAPQGAKFTVCNGYRENSVDVISFFYLV